MKISKSAATVVILLIGVALIFGVDLLKKSPKGILVNKTVSRAQGNPKASIHIVEYIDFECAACANGFRALKDYMVKYPSKIYLEVRYYPIARIHQHAIKSAMYAECTARQSKFLPFVDLLMEKQQIWSRLLNADGMFRELAQQAGVDLNKIADCVQDDKVKALILDEKEQAKVVGVESTPTYFINGKMLGGPKTLREELDRLLGGVGH